MNEKVEKYFLEKDFNCAESMVGILNETYGLGLDEKDFTLVSGFGGGCGCGHICGALAGCIAVLGKMQVTQRAHVTPGFKETCAAFCTRFEEDLGSSLCRELKPKYFAEGIRCAKLLDRATECFEAFAQDQNPGGKNL